MQFDAGDAEVQQLHKRPTTFRRRAGQDHDVSRLNGTVRQAMKRGGRDRPHHLERDPQRRIGRQRAVCDDPGIRRFPLQILGDENEALALQAGFADLGDIYVIELLHCLCSLFKRFARFWIDRRQRDQLQRNGITGSRIHSLIVNGRAAATNLFRRALLIGANAIMLKINCPLHKPPSSRALFARSN